DQLGHELEHRPGELLANGRVSVVASIRAPAPGGIGAVAGEDPCDPVALALRVYFSIVRVLFLSHYYPPELGAAPERIAALAHGLADRGVEVSVHTGFPHYPSGA